METMNEPNTHNPPYRQPGNRLTRSTDDKVLGGLSGGLGRYFGIDPVVFRIAFVVLTLAGGSGILLYLIGWLMIPDDAGGNALRRVGGERNQKLAAAVLAGVGLVILLDNLTGSNDDIPLGLVLVGMGGLFLWSRHRDEMGAGPPPPPDHPSPPVPPTPPAPPSPPAGDADRTLTVDATPTPAPAPPAPPARDPAQTPTQARAEPPSSAAGVGGAFAPPPPARPAKAPKPRSALVPVTFSLLAVLAGAATLVGVSVTTGLALALLLTGGALIVGAWRGRARWLIPVGLVLSVALAGTSLIDVPIRGGAGEIVYRPLTLEEIRTPYRWAAGEIHVDLADVDFRGQTVTIVASVAAGHLDIVVPGDVSVELDAHVGAGELMLLGRESEGIDIGREVTDAGREGAGRLILSARAGVGLVEVRRAFP